ncbi:uncharacterized protein LOC119163854 isoform X6 [Rhipicephalus microplus]|uniref:uncharacterized protein LOC119163854 isoform X6 n=1 Tax=Rhipicephalus microplus TaxID=6941 RepID=UPI003F6D878E
MSDTSTVARKEYPIRQWRALLKHLRAPSTSSQAPLSADTRTVEDWRPVNRRAHFLARLVQRLCCQYRWQTAAEALEVLLDGHYPADQFSYKVGMLLHENLASPEQMNFFIRHTRCLLVADKKEMALEYIVYCLKQMQHAHLRTFFQLLLRHDRADEADDIVESYLDSHSDDCLHAVSYARALSQQCSTAETSELAASRRMELLHRLCEADPTSPQVLEYVQLIEQNEEGVDSVVECLRLLADFVDCPDNKDSVDAWRKLSRIAVCTGRSEDAAVRDCGSRLWQERGDYWLPYHFSPHLDGSPEAWLMKTVFLQALGQTVGKAGAYISEVESKLLEHDADLLEKFRTAQEQVLHAPGLDHSLEEVLQAARFIVN